MDGAKVVQTNSILIQAIIQNASGARKLTGKFYKNARDAPADGVRRFHKRLGEGATISTMEVCTKTLLSSRDRSVFFNVSICIAISRINST